MKDHQSANLLERDTELASIDSLIDTLVIEAPARDGRDPWAAAD